MADPVLGPVQVGDAFKVSIVQKLYGQTVMNVLWYEVSIVTGGPFDRWAVQTAVANGVAAAGNVLTKLNNCQSEDVSNDYIRVNSYRNLADRVPFTMIDNADSGVLATPAGSANIAASIEKRAVGTAGKPRTGVGRMQVGGIPQDGYTAGLLSPGQTSVLTTLASQLLANLVVLTTVTLVPVIVTWGPTNILMHELFAAEVKPEVRDMRRRTVGRGI